MKRNEIIKLVLISFAILTVGYFSYKAMLLYKYNVDSRAIDEKYIEILENSNEIIKIESEDYNGEMSSYENLMYPELDEGFTYNAESSNTEGIQRYETYDLNNDGTLSSVFKIGISDLNFYDVIIAEDITVYGFNFREIDRKALIEKFGIENEKDLVSYVIDHYKDSSNIFSSKNKIKMNYLIRIFTNVIFPSSRISFITGDLEGFVFAIKENDFYEIHLEHNNENYIISFINVNESHYTFESIKDFLSKIKFK